MNKIDRVPLNQGQILSVSFLDSQKVEENSNYDEELYRLTIRVDALISDQGSTCLVYEGATLVDGKEEKRVILKECCPKVPLESEEAAGRWRQFLKGYRRQKAMANEKTVMELLVKPVGFGKWQNRFFIVSEMHHGHALELPQFKTLEEKLNLFIHLSDLLHILEKGNYLYLDICPENFLYIREGKRLEQIKLFDMDSMIRMDERESLSFCDLYYHEKYVSPLVGSLKEDTFEESKMISLVPKESWYSFGLMAFEMIYGYIPGREELAWDQEFQKKLGALAVKKYSISEVLAEKLMKTFQTLLPREYPLYRYRKAEEIVAQFEELAKQLQVEACLPKKPVKPDYLTFSYHLLEKYPVFRYAKRQGEGYWLDVAVIGNHELRFSIVQALISCVQMLDSTLAIRLLSEDAIHFWKDFVSDKRNPELKYAVELFIDGKPAGEPIDERLVGTALAKVYLYPTSDKDTVFTKLEEAGTNYVLSFEKEADHAFLFFDGRRKKKEIIIDTSRFAREYDEKEFKTRVSRMGLAVHGYYFRGGMPNAPLEQIKKDYLSSSYNQRSSERCALHMIYKLASLGITNFEAETLWDDIYEKVFSEKERLPGGNFEKLAWLEHRSWLGFMLTHGNVRFPVDEFEDGAYVGGNTWKDFRDKAHMRTPYLAASEPGRGLLHTDWFAKEPDPSWDELDRTSFFVYKKTISIAKKRRKRIESQLKMLKEVGFDGWNRQMEEAFAELFLALEKCYNLENNAGRYWQRTIKHWEEVCKEWNGYDARMKEEIGQLNIDMQPILEAVKKRDIKDADEDVLRAIPMIIREAWDDRTENTVLLKPVSKEPWQNVYSALLLEPSQIVYFSDQFSKEDRSFYRRFFKERGFGKMKIGSGLKSMIREKVYVDLTGVDAEIEKMLYEMPLLKDAIYFTVENRKIVAKNCPSVQLFQKNIKLTAAETLYLSGGYDLGWQKQSPLTQVRDEEYSYLWKIYKKCNGLNWKSFVENLQKINKRMVYPVDLKRKDEVHSYQSDDIDGMAFQLTGIKNILTYCELHGLIHDLEKPEADEEDAVSFRTAYSALAETVLSIIDTAREGRIKEHSYVVSHKKGDVLFIKNDSLYVKGSLSEESFRWMDCLTEEGKNNQIFSQVKRKKTEDGKEVSLKYASKGIRAVFEKEENLLAATVYSECLRAGIFDDICLNLADEMEEKELFNPVYLIGVRKSKTYFLGVSMDAPEEKQIEELNEMCRLYSIEGKAVVLTPDMENLIHIDQNGEITFQIGQIMAGFVGE